MQTVHGAGRPCGAAAEWRRVKLGDVLREAQVGFAAGERDPAGLLQLRMNNVTSDGTFDWSTVTRVPAGSVDLRKYHLAPGDILFNNTNSVELVGESALFLGYLEPVVFSNHFTRLRVAPDRADPAFVAFFLQARWRERLFANICNRWVGQAAVQRDKLLQLDMPLPPLPEQRRIAARLAEQLAAVERARFAAEQQRSMVQRLLPTHLEAAFSDEEARSWPARAIGDIARTGSGSTPSRSRKDYYGGDIPWVKTAELQDGTIIDTAEHVTDAAVAETSLKLFPAGTLLVAMYGQGQTRGRTGLLGVPATTNQACFAILPNGQVFDPRYLQWWFRYSYGRLRALSEGRGGNQPNLNGDLLRAERVPLPPLAAQHELADRLDRIEAATNRAEGALHAREQVIGQLPAALLRRAFSGGT